MTSIRSRKRTSRANFWYNFINQRTIADPNFLKFIAFTIAPLFHKRERENTDEGGSQTQGSDDSNGGCEHILLREVRIPGISGNFNGTGARTPPGEKRDPEWEWLDMVMGAHWANKVGPPRVMTGFARGPALIAFYLFLISRTPRAPYATQRRTRMDRQADRRIAGGHIRAQGSTAGCLRRHSLVLLQPATD